MARTLLPGIYAPTQVFYNINNDKHLDPETIRKHAIRLAKAGVAGIVTNGSNGEAVYLTQGERKQVTRVTRDSLDEAGFAKTPVIAGTSDQSVQGTLQLCQDAAEAGADAVLVMVPSFFKWAMTVPATTEQFFTDVADNSPLPVIIYNYPSAVAGIDLDSDLLIRLAKHPNIIGTKFTCGNVGKLARVAGVTNAVSEVFSPSNSGDPYFAFSGIADFITSAVEVGGAGAIVGAANVFPRACVNVYNLAVEGKRTEAMKAQHQLAAADWELTKRAVPGFKALLDYQFGYGGVPRAPMPALDADGTAQLVEDLRFMVKAEESLQDYGTLKHSV